MNTLMPLFEASLRGAMLIGVLGLLRMPLRRMIGSTWVCALWLIVLVRLLVPGSIESSWSVFNWWPQPRATNQAVTAPWQTRVRILPGNPSSEASAITVAPASRAADSAGDEINWIVLIWAIGAAGAAGHLGWRIAMTMRAARATRGAQNPHLLAAFDSLPARLRGHLQLRESDDLEVPALVGIWRPQIWIPTSWLESMSIAEMRHVLLHELGHARRGDLWVQWLFAISQCLHWFNPAVWLAARLAHADRELACDAWVLQRGGDEEPEQYGETLLKAALRLRSRWHLPPAAITMAMSKGSLVSRVRSIGQFRPIASWRAVLGSAAAALLLGSIGTDRLHAQSGAGSSGTPGQPPPAAGAPPAASPTGGGSGTVGDAGTFGGSFGLEKWDLPPGTKVGSGTISVPMPRPQVEIEGRFFEMPEAKWKALGLGGLSAPDDNTMAVRGVIDPSALHLLLSRINGAPSIAPSGGPGLPGVPAGVNPVTGSNRSGSLAFNNNAIDARLFGSANASEGVDLLSAPRVTTRSGQRAVIEIIREVRYATEFERDEKGVDGLTPTAFETRNVGVTLEAEPTVNFDGQTVDVLLVPQIVELTGYIRVRTGAPVPIDPDPNKKGFTGLLDAALPKDMVVQPIFSTRKVSTSVSLRSGQTLVLGGLKQATSSEPGKEPRILVVLITARILQTGATAAAATGAPPPELTPGDIFGVAGGGSRVGEVLEPLPSPTPGGLPGVSSARASGGGFGAPPPVAPVPGSPGSPGSPGAAPGGTGGVGIPGAPPSQPAAIQSGTNRTPNRLRPLGR
jgi:beta-lactamase regulating signal transducer with metallopeptidase domain